MKKFFIVLLTILLFFLLVFFAGIFSFQKTLAAANPLSLLSITSVNAEEFSKVDLQKIDNLTVEEIHEYLDPTLIENGIPTDALDYVLKEGNYQNLINQYVDRYESYLSGKGSKPELPEKEINQMIEQGIQKYNEDTGENLNVIRIQEKVNTALNRVEEKIDQVSENSVVKAGMKILTNRNIPIICILAIIGIAVLLILLNSNIVKSFFCFFLATLSSGFVLSLFGIILKSSFFDEFIFLIKNRFEMFANTIFYSGLIMLGVSIFFLILFLIFKKKRK